MTSQNGPSTARYTEKSDAEVRSPIGSLRSRGPSSETRGPGLPLEAVDRAEAEAPRLHEARGMKYVRP